MDCVPFMPPRFSLYTLIFVCLVVAPQGARSQKISPNDTARIIEIVNDPNTPDELKLSNMLELAAFFRSTNILDSYRYSNRAFLLADAIGDSTRKGIACRLMGVSYVLQGNNAEAARWTIRSYEIAKSFGSENDLLSSVINLGGIYYSLKDWSQCLFYSKRALTIGRETNNTRIIAASSEAIGLTYLKLRQTDSAELYFQVAMDLYRSAGNVKALANCMGSYASVFEQRNEYQAALRQIRETDNIYQSLDEGYISNEFLSHLLGAASILVKVNKLTEASGNLDQVDSVSKSQNLKGYLSDSYLLRSKIDSMRGNYAGSLKWLNAHMALRDSIMSSAKEKVIQSTIQMQKLQTDAAITLGDSKLSEAKLQNQRVILGIVLLALFILSLLTAELIRRNREVRLTNERLASKQSVIQKKNRNLEEIGRELLSQKKELETLNRNKDRWFGIISHDFRHPLTVLHGAISLMAEEDLPPEEQKMVFSNLAKQFSRTSFLLDNLLFWSQHQMDGWKANYEALPTSELLGPVLDSAEDWAKQKGILINRDRMDQFIMLTDPEAVRLIIRNFLNNAIKYSYTGNTIWVATKDSLEGSSISITDKGVGMTSEQVETAFDNIQQSTLGTQKEKGSGLGLTLCRDFATFLGGKLSVTSQPGKGSTFTLFLPKGGEPVQNYTYNQGSGEAE